MEIQRLVEEVPNVKHVSVSITRIVKKTQLCQEQASPYHHCLNSLCLKLLAVCILFKEE
jgi:hypothetical protein